MGGLVVDTQRYFVSVVLRGEPATNIGFGILEVYPHLACFSALFRGGEGVVNVPEL